MSELSVSEYMHKTTASVSAVMLVSQAVEILLEKRLSGIPVTDRDGMVTGFLSEQDCIRSMLSGSYHCENTALVGEVMSHAVTSVTPSESVLTVADMMIKQRIKMLPVTVNGELKGVISRADVLKALQVQLRACSIPTR
jgi:CBS domain-containing protein